MKTKKMKFESQGTLSRDALMDHSGYVAGWSNLNQETHGSLWWRSVDLYRHRGGRYFLRQTGGAGVAMSNDVKWLSDDEARDFIVNHCLDGRTGYAYTEDETSILMNGGDVRAETRSSHEINRPGW